MCKYKVEDEVKLKTSTKNVGKDNFTVGEKGKIVKIADEKFDGETMYKVNFNDKILWTSSFHLEKVD